MSQAQVFDIPVVFHDLRSGEALLQLFDSLERLNVVSDNLFMRIQSRVNFEKGRFAGIQARVDSCKSKIASIRGTTRATTVFSTAKYPAPDTLPDFPHLFTNIQEPEPPKKIAWQEKVIDFGKTNIAERRLDSTPLTWEHDREEKVVKRDGLGRLPHNVTSISSLLLFNTAENPYKKYVSLDNLLGVDRRKREKEKKELDAAPETILSGDVLPQFGKLEYQYRPQLGHVPDLNLPQTLPGMAGLADISWSTGGPGGSGSDGGLALPELPSIAPSMAELPALPTVDIIDFKPASVAAPAGTSVGIVTEPGAEAPSGDVGGAGPPPPPPPPGGMEEMGAVGGAGPPPPPPPPPAGGDLSGAPPPPGPPPPAAAPSGDMDVGGGSGDGRSDLLASIRNAGMKSLKKVDAPEGEDESKPPAASSDSGGGLMGDLFKQLALRRKAIGGSGAKGGNHKEGKKMSSADVRRPPKESMEGKLLEKAEAASRQAEKEDSDDDGAWD